MKTKFVLSLSMLGFISGCATQNAIQAVGERVEFDLKCPRNQVKILEIGGGAYGARGCGKQASYTTNRCWSGDFEGCKAQLNNVSDDSDKSTKPKGE